MVAWTAVANPAVTAGWRFQGDPRPTIQGPFSRQPHYPQSGSNPSGNCLEITNVPRRLKRVPSHLYAKQAVKYKPTRLPPAVLTSEASLKQPDGARSSQVVVDEGPTGYPHLQLLTKFSTGTVILIEIGKIRELDHDCPTLV